MKKLTYTMENYLEAIYILSSEEQGARVSDIANMLGVTKASTNSAMTTLAEKGLIINEKYKKVLLTPTGQKIAELTSRKHEVIFKLLTEVLKVDAAIADRDACEIEHVVSNETIEAIEEYLKKHDRCSPISS